MNDKEKQNCIRILLMDDDPFILDALEKLLENLEYEVKSISSGEQVIEHYQSALKRNTPYDIVIMDISMKFGMDGIETLHQLLKINPNVKAIVMSGFIEEEKKDYYKELGFSAVLPKPFKLKQLREIIEKVRKTEIE